MLVSAAVIYTHAEAFLCQTQNSFTFFDQLPIRVHYPTGFGWLLQEVLFDYKQGCDQSSGVARLSAALTTPQICLQNFK